MSAGVNAETIPCQWCREPIPLVPNEEAPLWCKPCMDSDFTRPRPKPTEAQLRALAELIRGSGQAEVRDGE